MAKDVYDVENLVFMIDGVECSDALDGEEVTIESVEDERTVRYSLKGKPLVTKNPKAKHKIVKFKLQKDHPMNIILMSKDSFPISCTDMNTNISNSSMVAHVMKTPSDNFGKDEQGEYEVLAEYMQRLQIGKL